MIRDEFGEPQEKYVTTHLPPREGEIHGDIVMEWLPNPKYKGPVTNYQHISDLEDDTRIVYNDTSIDDLEIKETANAWWKEEHRIYRLLIMLEIGCTVEEACEFAGITVRQYKYFVKEHPLFIRKKDMLTHNLIIKARRLVAANVLKSPRNAMQYLKYKRPEEFGTPSRRRKSDSSDTF